MADSSSGILVEAKWVFENRDPLQKRICKENIMTSKSVKDLVDSKVLYEKHNSFDNFRSKKTNAPVDINDRILALSKRLSKQNYSDYFWDIVKIAIQDILEKNDQPHA